MVIFWSMICVGRLLVFLNFPPYILKANKFAEPPFQSKKLRKKCGSFLGHLGSFGVILGPFGVIFGSLWAIFGPYCGIFEQICRKFKFFAG